VWLGLIPDRHPLDKAGFSYNLPRPSGPVGGFVDCRGSEAQKLTDVTAKVFEADELQAEAV